MFANLIEFFSTVSHMLARAFNQQAAVISLEFNRHRDVILFNNPAPCLKPSAVMVKCRADVNGPCRHLSALRFFDQEIVG